MWRMIMGLGMALLPFLGMYAQQSVVKGRILDSDSNMPVPKVDIRIQSTVYRTSSDDKGLFNIQSGNLPQGEQILLLTRNGYIDQKIPVTIKEGEILDLNPILLEADLSLAEAQIGIISLTDNELDQDQGASFNTAGLLQANRDAFLNAAAFDFSAAFFRPRGLDNAYSKLLINGIEMNRFASGRPQWSSWGGLNDAQRNRVYDPVLSASESSFGDVAGTTNIQMRASQYRKGGRLSFAAANRTYAGRVMASYNSGLSRSGWAYTLLASRRFGEEGFVAGTPYEANSFLASVEKKLSDRHSLNLTAFYTPNRRGRSTAVTSEVLELKGPRYNPNWGLQDGKIRSARVRRIEEPVVMINHYWQISERTFLNTNVGYQFGRVGNTRLGNSGNRNPAGNYYQRLPSYFLRDPTPSVNDYRLAYLAREEFIRDGQLDWAALYAANRASTDGNSVYVIEEDVNQDTQLTINTIWSHKFSQHFTVNGKFNYRSLKSENYAELNDLLGGNGYLDIDYFGDDPDLIQSDLQNPNRVVQKGDRFRYNYQLEASTISGFAQGEFTFKRADFFVAVTAGQTSYQRIGSYQNGYFPEPGRSLGAGRKVGFSTLGLKGGFTFKLSGRHLIDLTAGGLTRPPTLRNTFANARQNNDLVEGISPERTISADLGYLYRSPGFKSRITAFYTGFSNLTDIGFYFTQNALGNAENTAFVQEIVTGIATTHLGVEFGIEAQVLPSLKIKAAGSVGRYMYSDNAWLYLSGDDFDDPETPDVVEGNDLFDLGRRKVSLRGYRISAGPERVGQLGLEYRSPEYWWVGLTANYFEGAYIDISKLRRTRDFYTDVDGQPFNDYNQTIARSLLRQEKLDNYVLVNAVGGKSWRIRNYFVGFFAVVGNILGQNYRTGGFEDSRRASYRQQLAERNREHGPLFGNRYFSGYGATYYVNLYIRF